MTSPQPAAQPAPQPAATTTRSTGMPGTTTTRTTTTQVANTRPRISRPVLLLLLLGGLAVTATSMALWGPWAGAVPAVVAGVGYVAYKRRRREQLERQARGTRQAARQPTGGQRPPRTSLWERLRGLLGRGGARSGAGRPTGSRPGGGRSAGSRTGGGRSAGSRTGGGRSGGGKGLGLPKLGNPLKGMFSGGGKGSGGSKGGSRGSGSSGRGSGGGRSGGKGGGLGLPKLGNPFKSMFGGGGKGSGGSKGDGFGSRGGGSESAGRGGGRSGGGRGLGFRNPLKGLLSKLRGGGRSGAGSGGSTGSGGPNGASGAGSGGRRWLGSAGRRLGSAFGRLWPKRSSSAANGTPNSGSGFIGPRLPLGMRLARTRPGRAARWLGGTRIGRGLRWLAGLPAAGIANAAGRAQPHLANAGRRAKWLAAMLRAVHPRRAITAGPPKVSLIRKTPKAKRPVAPPLTLAQAYAPLNPPPPSGGGSPAGTGRSAMARAFQALIEQIGQTASAWEPVNENGEVAAQEIRQMVADAPEVFAALGRMWSTMAGKSTDQAWMDSGAADVLHGAAQYCTAPVAHLQEAATAMDRPHGDDIERIHRPDPRAAAWDWDRNQGYNV